MAYFDGPGGTQVPRPVVDAMADYLLHHNANTHWAYPTSVETDEALAAARGALADFLGGTAGRDRVRREHDDAHLPPGPGPRPALVGGRRGRRHRARPPRERGPVAASGQGARARRSHRPVPRRDGPARHGRPRLGHRPEDAAPGDRGRVERPRHEERRAAERPTSPTPQAPSSSWTPSTMPPTPSWTWRPSGPTSWPARPTSSTARTWASCGAVRPSSRSWTCRKLEPAPENAPDRLETGTQNHEGIVGAAAAVDFLASLAEGTDRRARLASSMAALHARGQALVASLWNGLRAIPGVTVYGPPPSEPRTPTVAFTVRGRGSEDVGESPRRPGRLRLERRLLRDHGRPPTRPRGGRRRPRRVRLLHDARRGEPADRGRL